MSTTTNNPASSITRTHFDQLPPASQQRLLERQAGTRKDQFRFKTGGTFGAWFFGLPALLWFPILFVLADDYQWDSSVKTLLGFATVFAGLIAGWAVRKVVRFHRARLRSFTYLTPLYVIKTKLDEVTYWSLWDLVDMQVTHNYTNGSYSNSTVAMTFKETKETFVLGKRAQVDELRGALATWGETLRQAQAANDWQTFAQMDDFRDARAYGQQAPQAPPKRGGLLRFAPLAAAFVALLIFGGAVFANDYLGDKKAWDNARASDLSQSYRSYLSRLPRGRWREEAERLSDERGWKEALDAKTASALRKYVADFPHGRHLGDADRAITRSYDTSAQKYVGARSAGFDTQASDAVLAVIGHARDAKDYHVRVAFERRNEISEDDLESRYRRRFGPVQILAVGDSFSDSKMASREQSILRAVRAAFAEIIPSDVLEFTDAGEAGSRPVFVVSYTVKSGETLFYRESDSHLPEQSRPYYPGVLFDWDFRIRVPEKSSYNFQLTSRPASSFSYTMSSRLGSSPGSERATIYDQMAESAFDNFRAELVRRLGLRGGTGAGSEETPTNTPRVIK